MLLLQSHANQANPLMIGKYTSLRRENSHKAEFLLVMKTFRNWFSKTNFAGNGSIYVQKEQTQVILPQKRTQTWVRLLEKNLLRTQ